MPSLGKKKEKKNKNKSEQNHAKSVMRKCCHVDSFSLVCKILTPN